MNAIESHIERISRFKGKVRPSDYLRLEEYAWALYQAIWNENNPLPYYQAEVRKAHLKKVIK